MTGRKTAQKLMAVGLFSVGVLGCGGGGGGGSGLAGGACDSLSARGTSDNQQIFNGESCDQVARTPVVAIFPIGRSGEQLFVASICTGALVTVDDILTSAHCFRDPFLALGDALAGFVVVVGGENGEAIQISNLALHPFYDGSVGSRYDIAMATLSRVPSPRIGPLPILVSQLSLPGQEFSVFGYGTSNQGEIGVLKSAEFRIEEIFNGNLLSSYIGSDNVSICGGDSGGPAVQVVNGVTTLIGVNSFGQFVGGETCPAIPARVSGFVDIQDEAVLEFIGNYAPDVAAN